MTTENSLLVLDRDGTLIEDAGYLGRNNNWREEIKLKKEVIDFISYVNKKNSCVKIVVTNQSGVARGYFDCNTVEETNKEINRALLDKGIKIDNWQYCPDVDEKYTQSINDMDFNVDFVKEQTKRKPKPDMVYDALYELGKKLDDFSRIVVVGDKNDDEWLAKNLNAKFIIVKNETCGEMIKKFEND